MPSALCFSQTGEVNLSVGEDSIPDDFADLDYLIHYAGVAS